MRCGGVWPVPIEHEPGAGAAAYVDSLIAQKLIYITIPGAMSDVLRSATRERVDSVVEIAVLRDAAVAWQRTHAADTTTNPATGASRRRGPFGRVRQRRSPHPETHTEIEV